MPRKIIIQTIVIVICFSSAVLVLYNGLFKKSNPSPTGGPRSVLVPGAGGAAALNPLPYGDNLKGELKKVLSRNNLQYNILSYPIVDASEAGIPVTNLVKPLPRALK